MLSVAFIPDAFNDFNNWAETDKQVFKRLVSIINDCQRSPFKGIGKPEPLKHHFKGCWSRRITDEHRLVYQVTGDHFLPVSLLVTRLAKNFIYLVITSFPLQTGAWPDSEIILYK